MTTAEDIMKLAFNASHAETEHSADKWFAQLRTAVKSLVVDAERYRKWRDDFSGAEVTDMLLAISDAWTADEVDAAIDAALRGQP